MWDHASARVSVLDADARYVRAWPHLDGVAGWYFIVGQFPDGSLLAELPDGSPPPTKAGVVTRDMLLARIALNSASIDTLGRFLREENVVTLNAKGMVTGSARVPLARFGHVATDGATFLFGDGTGSMAVYRSDGVLIDSLPLSAAPTAMTADERLAAMREGVSARMPPSLRVALEQSFDEILARPIVVYDSVLADGAGRVWVRDAAVSGGGNAPGRSTTGPAVLPHASAFLRPWRSLKWAWTTSS